MCHPNTTRIIHESFTAANCEQERTKSARWPSVRQSDATQFCMAAVLNSPKRPKKLRNAREKAWSSRWRYHTHSNSQSTTQNLSRRLCLTKPTWQKDDGTKIAWSRHNNLRLRPRRGLESIRCHSSLPNSRCVAYQVQHHGGYQCCCFNFDRVTYILYPEI